MKRTVLVTGGTGHVGNNAVNYLSRSPGVERLIFVARNEHKLQTVYNNTIISAALGESYPELSYRSHNIMDVDATAELINEVQPDVVLNMAAGRSEFPSYYLKKKSTGGYFILKDLALLYSLMQGVKKSGFETNVVNVGNPDNTHYILSKAGLGPIIGGGTIDLTVQGVRRAVSERLKIPIHNVNVTMVSHVSLRGRPPLSDSEEKVPFYVKILVGEKDVTDEIDLDAVVSEGCWNTFHVKNITNAQMTAASAARNTLAVLNDTGELRHGAGIEGMIGGVPARLNGEGAKMVLPEGMTRKEALEMNSVGMRIMGIEKVKDGGTVVWTKKSKELLEDALDLNWPESKLDDVPRMAGEYVDAYNEMLRRLNPDHFK